MSDQDISKEETLDEINAQLDKKPKIADSIWAKAGPAASHPKVPEIPKIKQNNNMSHKQKEEKHMQKFITPYAAKLLGCKPTPVDDVGQPIFTDTSVVLISASAHPVGAKSVPVNQAHALTMPATTVLGLSASKWATPASKKI